MSSQEQVDTLVLEIKEIFDFDELESQIYLKLLKTGPITASAMAKNLDVDRAGMYRTVEKMIKKNVIFSTLSTPRLLTPIEPKKALKQVLEKKEGEVKKIQHSGMEIIHKINRKFSTFHGTQIPTLTTIQGKENIYAEIAQLIEDCREMAFIVTTVEDLANMTNTVIPEKIKLCQNNGGKVFLLVDGDERKVASVSKDFKATEVKTCKLLSKGRIAVCKNSKMIMTDSTQSSKSTPDYSISTNARDMIDNIDCFCKILWESAKPLNQNLH